MTLLFALLLSYAHAAVELRAPIGAAFVRPTELNDSQPSPLKIQYSGNFGADAIYDLGDYGFGLQFDSISAVRADGALKDGDAIEVANHIFSLLGRKRWEIDNLSYWPRYLAINGTVAFYSPSYVNTHAAGGSWIQYKTTNLGHASVGAEGGWVRDPFIVAGELGYQYIVLRNLETDQGVRLNKNVDMSGPYLKLILGLRF